MLFESIFTTLPMFVCLFGSILLLTDSKKQLPKRYLAFFLLISFINYFSHAVYFNHQYKLFGLMDNCWILTSLSGYPLFYYYIRLLTKDEQINWRWLWSLLPAILLFVFSLVLYFMMSPKEMESYIQGVMYHNNEYFKLSTNIIALEIIKNKMFKIIFLIQVPIYLFMGYKIINKFDREIKSYYSNLTDKDMSRVKGVLYAFVFASIISMLSSAIGRDYFIDKPYLLILPSFTHSLFLIAIIFVGKNQHFTIADYHKELARNPIKEELRENLHVKTQQKLLEKLLEENKIFTDSELRITDLASMMGTNRTYISRIIQEDFHTNFNDLINRYRVKYAKELMLDIKNNYITLNEIAIASGFSSTSTFYRVFNNYEKISPGKFRKIISKS